MIKRVYIDTSVVGGRFDKEFLEDTIPFFKSVVNGIFHIVISDLLEAELLRAPEHVRQFLNDVPERFVERIRLSEEAASLADKYITANVVGKSRLPAHRHGYNCERRCISELEF